eukprot:scaffold196030_cov29-Prasinocladus_malaysianus.AAC.1
MHISHGKLALRADAARFLPTDLMLLHAVTRKPSPAQVRPLISTVYSLTLPGIIIFRMQRSSGPPYEHLPDKSQ